MTLPGSVLAAGTYVHLGWFRMSVGNLLFFVVMVALLVAAVVVPFPHSDRSRKGRR